MTNTSRLSADKGDMSKDPIRQAQGKQGGEKEELSIDKMWEVLGWYRKWEYEKEQFEVKGLLLGKIVQFMSFDTWLKDLTMGGMVVKIYEEQLL